MADTIKDTIIAYAKNYTRQETGIIMGGEHLCLDQALAEIKRIVSEAKPEVDPNDYPTDYYDAVNEYHTNLMKALGEERE